MINRVEILRKYHDQSIVITLSNREESLSGMIIDDSPVDHCVFVQDPDLIDYYETKDESLLNMVYFKDMKTIEYQ